MNKQFETLYDKICRELTIFENSDEEIDEITYEDWATIFYHLLIEVQNTFETFSEE